MIVYNISFLIDKDIVDSGLAYLSDEFINAAMSHGLTDPCVRKLLFIPDNEPETYAIQFNVSDIDRLHAWNSGSEAIILGRLREKFGERILHFSTVLEEISISDEQQ